MPLSVKESITHLCHFPPVAFDARHLDWWSIQCKSVIHKWLTQFTEEAWNAPCADAGIESFDSLFAKNSSEHCFHAPAHKWANFHEPQITSGLAHFLNSGPLFTRSGRSIAVLKAVWNGSPPTNIDNVVEPEVRAEVGKIDLSVVALATDGELIGTVIEAKFAHKLTENQLGNYLRKASGIGYPKLERCAFVVIAPYSNDTITNHLRSQVNWRFLSWWRFLKNLEDHLTPECDDDDFRRFRRTIWDRAYGA